MRKINAKMIVAIRDLMGKADHNGDYFRLANTIVSQWHDGPCQKPGYSRVIEVKLHLNTIARIYPDICRMYVRDCGWRTATTKSRLNALLGALCGKDGDSITQSRGQWYTSRGEWLKAGNDWQDCHWYVAPHADNWMLKAAEMVAKG